MIAVKQVEIPRTASDKDDSRQVSVVEALKLESETLKDLDHPHIVSYLGFEETPTFLSMYVGNVFSSQEWSLIKMDAASWNTFLVVRSPVAFGNTDGSTGRSRNHSPVRSWKVLSTSTHEVFYIEYVPRRRSTKFIFLTSL